MMATSGGVRMRRWVKVAVFGPAILLVIAVAVVAVVWPSVTATGCPRCYGMVRVQDGVYAQDDTRSAEMTALVADAERRVGDFFGGRRTSPSVVACFTDDCYARIGGGGERGVAVLNRAVMLSPRGLDPVIVAHEMTHVEVHRRAGVDLPQWFDEGLAVVVSDDRRYLLPPGSADRCRVEPAGPLPVTLGEGLQAASADEQTYARAACRVSRLLDEAGRPELVTGLGDDEWRQAHLGR